MKSRVYLFAVVATAIFFSGCFAKVKRAAYTHAPSVGTSKWLVIKCKYSDTPDIPEDADETIEDVLNGTEGVREWFFDISHGVYIPDFEIKSEWKTMDISLAEDKANSLKRFDRIENCIKAWGIDRDQYAGVIANVNVQVDAGHANNVLLDPPAWHVTPIVHEMIHRMGVLHSFDTSDRKNNEWSKPGEYFDPWDMMSAMAVFGYDNDNGFVAGPDLALPFKLHLKWLSIPNDVELIDARTEKSGKTAKIKIRPYPELTGKDPLGVCIDVADDDSGFTRYCAEYRVKTGWDRAIPEDGVLIHFIKNGIVPGNKMTVVVDHALKAGESYTTQNGKATFHIRELGQKQATIGIEY